MPLLHHASLVSSLFLATSASSATAECDRVASVFFEYRSAVVLTRARQTLEVLAAQLPTGSRVVLRGHISAEELAEDGSTGLDENRAAVTAYRLSAAADAKTLTVERESAGSTEPYSAEGPDQAFDRRVDIWLCPAGA
jgi:hypothetical protein